MVFAITVGAWLGRYHPASGIQMKPFSDGFVRLIGMLIGVLMFSLVMSGIAGMQNKMQAARIGLKAIVYFEAMAAMSLAAGILAAYVLGPGKNFSFSFPIESTGDPYTHIPPIAGTSDFFLQMIPESFIGAFVSNNSLQILLLALLAGIALSRLGERGRNFLALIEETLQILYGMINIILKVAPLAAFGAVAFTIGKYGMQSVLPLLHFVGAIYLVSVVFVCGAMGIIARVAGCNIFRLIAYIKEELSLVFFTTSSMAALPGLIKKMEKIGCAKPIVRLVLPAGYTFNLNGTNIYIGMAVVFLAQATHIDLSHWQMLSLLAIAMLTSKSAASVTGSGFIALAATLTALQIVPVAGVVLLLGVDRLLKCRSLTNVIGNCLACVVVCAWGNELDRHAMHQVLSGKSPEFSSSTEPI